MHTEKVMIAELIFKFFERFGNSDFPSVFEKKMRVVYICLTPNDFRYQHKLNPIDRRQSKFFGKFGIGTPVFQ